MNLQLNRTRFSLLAILILGMAVSGCTMAQAIEPGLESTSDSSEISAAQVNEDLTEFDLSNNGVLDDDEFFRVIDMWITAKVNNMTFFRVIDAWASQAELAVIVQKSDEPDKSKIHLYRGRPAGGGTYMLGHPGAVEPRAQVIIRDVRGNIGFTIAEFDGSFRFSTFDLPDGFDNTVGNVVEVSQKEEGKQTSNPVDIVIFFN